MKILFLQEYIRESHMKKTESGEFKNVFLQTKAGKILGKLIEDGLKLKKSDFYIDYAYGLVPKVLLRDKYNKAVKYKQPALKEARPEFDLLYERIVREKPDIIVPSGNLGCKALINQAAISKQRGVPQKVTITAKSDISDMEKEMKIVDLQKMLERLEDEMSSFLKVYGDQLEDSKAFQREHDKLQGEIDDCHAKIQQLNDSEMSHTCWVLPMYSMEYMLVNPSIQNLIEADFVTLQKFIEQGSSAFEAQPVEYEFVKTIERVREIFKKEIPAAPVIAWDLETNTLRPELPGAKPLVISLSWAEGTGVTIPLEHKHSHWSVMELSEVYKLIAELMADENKVKVGHNI